MARAAARSAPANVATGQTTKSSTTSRWLLLRARVAKEGATRRDSWIRPAERAPRPPVGGPLAGTPAGVSTPDSATFLLPAGRAARPVGCLLESSQPSLPHRTRRERPVRQSAQCCSPREHKCRRARRAAKAGQSGPPWAGLESRQNRASLLARPQLTVGPMQKYQATPAALPDSRKCRSPARAETSRADSRSDRPAIAGPSWPGAC